MISFIVFTQSKDRQKGITKKFLDRSGISLIHLTSRDAIVAKQDAVVNVSADNLGIGEKIAPDSERSARLTSNPHARRQLGVVGSNPTFKYTMN